MKKTTLKKIFIALKKELPLLILSLICAAFSVITALLIPYYFGKMIDTINLNNQVNFSLMYHYIIIVLSLIPTSAILTFLMSLINNQVVYKLGKNLRIAAFKKYNKLPLAYLDSTPSGKIINTIIVNVDEFSDGLLMALSQFFTGILTIIGVIVILFTINYLIALIVVILTPLSLGVAKLIASNSYKSFKAQTEERGNQTTIIEEMIGNEKAVINLNYSNEAYETFKEENSKMAKISLKAIFISSLVNPSTRLVNALIYAVVALVGALLTIKENPLLTIGALSAVLDYATKYTKPFNEVTSVLTELQNSIACAEKIFNLIEEESEIDNEKDLIINKDELVLKLQDVSFGYDKEKQILKHLNLEVKKGMKVAIVGKTGCGKTTLINLLMRFYDCDSGMITLNNQNIKNYSKKSLRKYFGMVLQDSWIKNASIKENIQMNQENLSDEEINKALNDAKINYFINQLSEGINTVINDSDGLSAGQKQLISIARVMALKREILLLDEATSNLDTRTEALVNKAFLKLMENKTSIIVAHRLKTILDADLIIVMDDGKIIEQGNHQELILKHGYYYELYNAQFKYQA